MENFVASDKPRICTNHFIDDWWEAKRKTPQPNIITDYPEQEKMSFSFSFFFFFFFFEIRKLYLLSVFCLKERLLQ